MSDDLQKRLESFIDTMATPGWQAMMEDFEVEFTRLNQAVGVKDVDVLRYRQGQCDVIANLLNLKSSIEAELDSLLNPEEDEGNELEQ